MSRRRKLGAEIMKGEGVSFRVFAPDREGVEVVVYEGEAQSRTGLAVYASNLILCLGLWISLLVAIWLTRGWIGLLFSGQLLSGGAKLFETLSKRTHYAFSAGNAPAYELEGDRNE